MAQSSQKTGYVLIQDGAVVTEDGKCGLVIRARAGGVCVAYLPLSFTDKPQGYSGKRPPGPDNWRRRVGLPPMVATPPTETPDRAYRPKTGRRTQTARLKDFRLPRKTVPRDTGELRDQATQRESGR
ncbi:hypothetical protein NDU88_003416 [Pleurodeles waltl]|uniref:Uncharacterized protein n=1 Tax=Pleurodeles waltl TaxID=8319 RepID=A0AAV7V003_PLEWA|nr:hypothetical protein NDU88_003416 [Pleurodeles waltl]